MDIITATAPEAVEKKPKRRLKRRTKIILTCTVCVLLAVALTVGFILPMILVHQLYTPVFAGHLNASDADLEGLRQLETVQFPSNMGQMLTGAFYLDEALPSPAQAKGLIVISHGIGNGREGGHYQYSLEIKAFAKAGYLVFGFDNTGYAASEGDNRVGLAQAPVDLEFALLYLESREDLAALPLMLYGHSWGGYAVCSVLNNTHDIRAVVSRSGFNRSVDMLVEQGSNMYGDLVSTVSGYIYLYEHFRFGKVVSQTAAKGLKSTEAKALVLWGDQDEIISEKSSVYGHWHEYENNPNITVELMPGIGHNTLTPEKLTQIISFYDAAL